MFRRQAIFIALLGMLAGCNSLPAGALSAVGSSSGSARCGEVYLLRGWRGLWSEGIDTLAGRLRGEGVTAHVFQHSQWEELADALAEKRSGSGARSEPLVVIGFSYGADDGIRATRRLGERGVGVDLLVTLDPVTPPEIPASVARAVNFYQSNGVWDAFPWLRGVAVRGAEGHPSPPVNIDIRDRPDLLEPDTGHDSIAANPKVHAAIVEEVLGVCRVRSALCGENGHRGTEAQRRRDGMEGCDVIDVTRVFDPCERRWNGGESCSFTQQWILQLTESGDSAPSARVANPCHVERSFQVPKRMGASSVAASQSLAPPLCLCASVAIPSFAIKPPAMFFPLASIVTGQIGRIWVPGLVIGIVVGAYWYRVARMARKQRRKTGRAANFLPPEPLGRVLRIIWVPAVVLWIVHPLAAAVLRDAPIRLIRPLWSVPVLPWIAAGVVVLCFVATRICWRRMGSAWRMGIDPDERNPLIATGPFAYVRHPIYALSALMMLATMAALPTPLMLAAGIIHVALLTWESMREERHLLRIHGPAYGDYRARVGRFLPRSARPYKAMRVSDPVAPPP